MGYASVLESLKIECEACLSIKDDDDSKFPKINDKDNDQKIIIWSPIFKYFLSNSHGSRWPLTHVFREDTNVSDEPVDLLIAN